MAAPSPDQGFAPDSRPALVFVHGYYGSALRHQRSKRRVFLSAREILLGRQPYTLFSDLLGTPRGPELEVEGVFDHVPVVPLFYSVDVYGKFLEFSRALPGVQVVPVVYDWRQDLGKAVEQLGATIEALRAAGSPKIAVMAHSMGGLVTAYYLGYGAQPIESAALTWTGAREIDRVYFLGTPFGGSFGIFRNLQRGAGFAWNRHLLPREAVASFPASYALLPRRGRLIALPNRQTEERALLDYDFWEDYQLGLLARPGLPAEFRRARKEFTRAQLERWSQFGTRLELTQAPAFSLPGVVNVVNRTRGTVDAAYFDPASKELFFDTDKLRRRGLDRAALLAPGDGTVSLAAAQPPPALAAQAREIDSPLAHDRLFEDSDLQKDLSQYFSQ